MKTKPKTKNKPAPAVTPVPPVNPVPPPPPELDIEPWKVVTTQSKPKEIMGRVVITIASRLQYRGRTMAILTGHTAAALQAMANQNNAAGRIPTTHKKAYADLPEGARSTVASKRCNQDNIMQPFEG